MKIIADTLKIEVTTSELQDIYEALQLKETEECRDHPHTRDKINRRQMIIQIGMVTGRDEETRDFFDRLEKIEQQRNGIRK